MVETTTEAGVDGGGHGGGGGHSPLEQFEIHTIAELKLGGLDLSFTNASLITRSSAPSPVTAECVPLVPRVPRGPGVPLLGAPGTGVARVGRTTRMFSGLMSRWITSRSWA